MFKDKVYKLKTISEKGKKRNASMGDIREGQEKERAYGKKKRKGKARKMRFSLHSAFLLLDSVRG